MLEISVQIEAIEASKLNDKVTESMNSNYALNVSLSEKERTSDTLVLTFALTLTSQPQAANFKVAGSAALKGTKDEIKGGITAPDDNKPPPVLLTIYERIYSTLYVLAGVMKVPQPLPNLLKKAP